MHTRGRHFPNCAISPSNCARLAEIRIYGSTEPDSHVLIKAVSLLSRCPIGIFPTVQ